MDLDRGLSIGALDRGLWIGGSGWGALDLELWIGGSGSGALDLGLWMGQTAALHGPPLTLPKQVARGGPVACVLVCALTLASASASASIGSEASAGPAMACAKAVTPPSLASCFCHSGTSGRASIGGRASGCNAPERGGGQREGRHAGSVRAATQQAAECCVRLCPHQLRGSVVGHSPPTHPRQHGRGRPRQSPCAHASRRIRGSTGASPHAQPRRARAHRRWGPMAQRHGAQRRPPRRRGRAAGRAPLAAHCGAARGRSRGCLCRRAPHE